jgi:hypothetical protein
MIVVDSGEIRVLALRHIIKLIQQGEADALASHGLTTADQHRLCTLTSQEIVELAQMKHLRFEFRCDFGSLAFALDTHTNVRDRRATTDYFIANGASLAQLLELFGIARREAMERRSALCPNHRRGRPALPRDAEREAIAATWTTLSAADGKTGTDPQDDLVHRYKRLHEAYPHISIAALETIVLSHAQITPTHGSKSIP